MPFKTSVKIIYCRLEGGRGGVDKFENLNKGHMLDTF